MEPKDFKEQGKSTSQSIDYIKIFKILWSRWYWIVACIIISCIFTYFYLWYTPSIYATSASIKFDDQQPELPGIIKNNSSFESSNRLQSETYVIQSREVILNAIAKINYQISYFLDGRVRTTETYPFEPFKIIILSKDSMSFYQKPISFQQIDSSHFILTINQKDIKYTFNQKISLPGISFLIKNANVPEEASYSFKFNQKEDFIGRVNAGLSMREAAKSSNILLVSLMDKNPFFASDVLNALLLEYINYDLSQKRVSGDQTIDFIESQLDFLNRKVDESGSKLENFKINKQISNPSSNSELQISKITSIKENLNTLELESLYINALEKQVKSSKNSINYNFNLEGKTEALLSNLIFELNTLITQRARALSQFNENSTPIINIDQQIKIFQNSIIQNISSLKERNQKDQDFYQNLLRQAQNKMAQLPAAEREFINLQSNFETDQTVFQLLSQKKLEAQINRAAVVPSAVIVEKAGVGSRLISPLPSKAYTYGVLAGLAFSILLVIFARLINPYIYDKNTVENLTDVPIIGIIRKFPDFIDKNNTQALSLSHPKSVFAESVRSVRTNLSFLASEKKSKVICITSEVSGEGKSFVSINLGSTLALIDKKVILIAGDLRKSKIHRTFGVDNKKGLSSYLANRDGIADIIFHADNHSFDFIPSGPVPPNPSELLHSNRMQQLIEHLKHQYDFILIDTAPVGLVSDAIPLIRQSDINAFIIRSGVSRNNAASIPAKLNSEYNLKNVVLILNAFGNEMLHSSFYASSYNDKNYAYYYYADYNGYGYEGYFENNRKRKWYEFWKKG
ncbi:MAG: polysaccharide biosynthesis tyrosine autokinase [Pelobium sp.]